MPHSSFTFFEDWTISATVTFQEPFGTVMLLATAAASVRTAKLVFLLLLGIPGDRGLSLIAVRLCWGECSKLFRLPELTSLGDWWDCVILGNILRWGLSSLEIFFKPPKSFPKRGL